MARNKSKLNRRLATEEGNPPRNNGGLPSSVASVIISWLAYAVLAVPLFSSVYFYPTFTGIQTFLLRGLIELMLVFYIWLVLKDKRFLPSFNWITCSLIGFLAVYFLSAIFGVNFNKSIFSTFERHLGFITISHLVVFFIILTSVFKDTVLQWRKFIMTSVGVSGIVALYGTYRFILYGDHERIYSTIGNPIPLATYLLLHALLALWLFINSIQSKEGKKEGNPPLFCGGLPSFGLVARIGLACVGVLNIVVSLLTATRANFLAIIGGLVILACGYIFGVYKGHIKKDIIFKFTLSIFVTVFISISSIFIFHDSSFVKNSPVLSRFTDISFSSESSQTRLFAWRSAWQGFLQNPILGSGPENFDAVFNKNFDSNYYTYDRGETEFDRTHNAFLEYLSTMGILGIFSYLFICAVFLHYLFRLYRNKVVDYYFVTIFLAFLAVYNIENFFSFDTYTSFLPLLLALGLFHAFSMQKKEEDDPPQNNGGSSSSFLVSLFWSVIGIAFIFWASIISPMKSNAHFSDAYDFYLQLNEDNQLDREKILQAFPKYEKALNQNAIYGKETILPFLSKFTILFYEKFGKDGVGDEYKNKYLPWVLEKNIQWIQDDSNNYFAYNYLARIYNINYLITGNESKELEADIIKAQGLASNRLEIPFALAQTDLLKKDFDAVIKKSEDSLKKNPNFIDFYHLLFLAYNFKNEPEKAFDVVTEGIKHGFQFKNPKEIEWFKKYSNSIPIK